MNDRVIWAAFLEDYLKKEEHWNHMWWNFHDILNNQVNTHENRFFLFTKVLCLITVLLMRKWNYGLWNSHVYKFRYFIKLKLTYWDRRFGFIIEHTFFSVSFLRKFVFIPSSLIFRERTFCVLFRSNKDSFHLVCQAAAKISVIVFKLICTFLAAFSTT